MITDLITRCHRHGLAFGLVRGWVFQRTKGRGKPWSYVVDVGVGASGKRRQRLKGGFHTRAELPWSRHCGDHRFGRGSTCCAHCAASHLSVPGSTG